MTSRVFFFLLFFFTNYIGYTQQISGIVLDAKNGEPIESVSIYFDNTTIGTTTNSKGEFSIEYREDIKSLLIFSFLGYKKSYISNYSPSKKYKVLLEEDLNTLDAVVITHDDGMSREIKLNQFKTQFLGSTKNARSCKILNEDDIILRYFKKEKQLTASSRKPILVKNNNLQYLISYDLNDFKVDYAHVNVEMKQFYTKLVLYSGTSRYENLEKSNKKRIKKNRQKSYKGSSLHFMRALANNRLKKENYIILKKGYAVNVEDFFFVTYNESTKSATVKLKEPVTIFHNKKQSRFECKADEFFIDQYGNHTPIDKVIFGGYMGRQRLADSVPLDYEISSTN